MTEMRAGLRWRHAGAEPRGRPRTLCSVSRGSHRDTPAFETLSAALVLQQTISVVAGKRVTEFEESRGRVVEHLEDLVALLRGKADQVRLDRQAVSDHCCGFRMALVKQPPDERLAVFFVDVCAEQVHAGGFLQA